MAAYRFNPPPNWPSPPQDWAPPAGWQPDPSWPAPPAGWELWLPEEPAGAETALGNAWWSGSRAPGSEDRTVPAVAGAFGAPPALPTDTAVLPAPPSTAPSRTVPSLVLDPGESEVEQLRAWITRTQGMDALRAQEAVRQLREQVAEARAAALTDAEAIRKVARDEARGLIEEAETAGREAEHAHEEAEHSQEELARSRSELAGLRARIVTAEESVLLQEAGIYAYHNQLDDAVACRSELDQVQGEIKDLVKNGAVETAEGAEFDASAAAVRKLGREVAKLMLRAYNAEADNAVLTARPHRAESMVERMARCRETVEKAGAPFGLRLSDAFHEARLRELRLASALVDLKEREKLAERSTRAKEREEATARKELERELDRLRKEEQRCRTALEKARKQADPAVTEQAEADLSEVSARLADIGKRTFEARAGHLYVVSNAGAFGPEVVRIGVSRRPDPLEEIAELSGASVPFPYDVHALVRSDDALGMLERLHEEFAGSRMNEVDDARGFYRVPPSRVREALSGIAGDALVEFTDEQAALEWRAGSALG
jgi:hypothetical protein